MRLELERGAGENLVSGYGESFVSVNNVRYEHSLLLTPRSIGRWEVAGIEQLADADFEQLAALGAEIVILGTGAVQRFPPRAFARRFAAAGIGLEAMDSRAACRTYNILASEGRRVLAAIWIEPRPR